MVSEMRWRLHTQEGRAPRRGAVDRTLWEYAGMSAKWKRYETKRNFDILERHLSGESTRSIAKRYKLSRSRIWQIYTVLKKALKKKMAEQSNG